jgi:dihydroflavonol-4-reductase
MTTVLVTGVSGFVGAAVARRLEATGYRVRALVRRSSPRGNLDGLKAEVVVGDLADREVLRRAVAGCTGVFHVAADYRLWVRDPGPMFATNVDGTRNVMLACLEAGVDRVVYTSSVATLGINADGKPADEETPSALENMIGPYKRSKFLAEQEVQRLVKEQGLKAVIVNPSTPIGPGDVKPTPTGRMILEAAAGRMPAYVDTGLNVVHVDDVAAGHILAFERGAIGARYILGGRNLTLRQILVEIADIVGRRPPSVRVPHAVVMPIAYLAEGWARLRRSSGDPFVTIDSVKMARKKMFFSSAKAEAELGYTARPVRQALRDAISWYRNNGYL